MDRILVIQHGDFREAYRRFSDGGKETYRDQKRSVDFVAGLAPDSVVTTLAFSRERYEEELAPNLWATGAPIGAMKPQAIKTIFDHLNPTRVILRTPHSRLIAEVRRRQIPLLPVFADIFSAKGLKTRLRYWYLRRSLLKCRAPCIANHSLNATRSLITELKLPEERVVAWDWSRVPSGGDVKPSVTDTTRPSAFFAGILTEAKGVGDCLQMVEILKRRGQWITMRFAGGGDLEHWRKEAERLGIADRVDFLGLLPNDRVRKLMREHDFVIVPSRHDYAEGLPNTIYEALASRSVLVLSDHPAFQGRFAPNEEVLEYPTEQPERLADCLSRAITDPTLYQRLSQNGAAAHQRLYIGMEWTELVAAFLDDPEDRKSWVARNRLLMHCI
ncbi:glycosyl transferase, group 1 [Roseobacter sp. AzwK-3b]|uniref:glycosyltransferase family 4 protein n=1 Tax=Roseobacter sp. AzwK-3b TaxID=351016 RepID=UPI00015697D4|nr:glycosyltransferase family 4 protein [Roseobacter sp. AzwK-3b]EDM72731.1 glycosyl transferase, group 1 [Roseobacter sp. AzwK-3b]